MKKMKLAVCLATLMGTAGLMGNAVAADNLAEFHEQNQECDSCHTPDGELSNDSLTYENAQCVSCHGTLAKVAETTKHEHYNAHASHFPGEVACTSCHSAHEKSMVYCDSCHSFDFNMPYAKKWKRDEPTIAELAKDKTERQAALASAPHDTVDVVVVGSGGAGFSAAISATDNGAKVILIEKEPVIGGNAKLAAGGMNAAWTDQQKAKEIKDSPELMFKDTMKGGRDINDPALVEVLSSHSKGSVDWMTKMGADLTDVGMMGGASVKRAHRPTGGAGVGAHVVQVLYDNAVKRNIDLRMNTRGIEVLKDDSGKVKGILVKGMYKGYYWVKADAVILATGGFAKNNERVAKLDPSLKGFISTNQPGAVGDGLDVAENAGGALKDMEYIQAHPTLSVKGGVMVTEAVRGNGAILVNREGKRFVNEITTRDKASAAILAQTGKSAYLIFDDSVRKSLSKIDKYIGLGVAPSADSLVKLGKMEGIDGKALTETVARYNSLVSSGKDTDFERPNLPRALNEGNYYAIEVTPGVHHTMGGVMIDTKTEVMNAQKQVIPGLYGAGEVTGGVHGANRLGGNAISGIITFGRLAGEEAAKYSKKN
ncbi:MULTISPECIES: flavocytochrome c [Shewanella]|uniref:flavocytochrome c n=1 Tax=Shewanella TaxID=22 RepID=UPI000C3E9CF0|nr:MULTISPECIES: flavocytochrome c [Shewanella]NCQ45128.1 flavocytochrome c [Shewanella frigidimarina]NCO70884.1 flavocytochrome c [Shewanella vesiculosa]NCP37001.1 flavocytochrome c [Shewanella vesiculosa]NCP68906.1 flavocytochrome c [Shewanella vesiculosa]NCP74338.1 flavocytochrome c [Shewanella vesiculosa]